MPPNFDRAKGLRQKLNVSLVLFSLCTIVAAYYLVASTINYTEFYRAIREVNLINLKVDTVVEQRSVNISLSFEIQNPTRYVGLKLREVTCQLYFADNNEKVVLWWGLKSYGTSQPLDPYSKVSLEWSFSPAASTDRFLTYFENHQGAINWMIQCGVRLAAFLPQDISISLTESYIAQ